MDPQIWYEIIGYAGMAFVVASFLFKKILVLRFLNLVGAILCAIYGVLTKTWPTLALNVSLALINGIYLTYYSIQQQKKRAEAKPSEEQEKAEE